MAAEFITLRDGNNQGCQLPPLGMKFAQAIDLRTPGYNAGSFLIDPKTGKQAVFTPMDEETGICYPIVTDRALPPVGQCVVDDLVAANWNHKNHPKDGLRYGTQEELALRNSRVEWVHVDDHIAYHDEFYGPDIKRIGDLLVPIIFAAAGFIPDRALLYDGRVRAKVVDLDEAYRSYLWKSGRVKIGNDLTVKDALVSRSLSKDFNGINATIINEFLSTTNLSRRFKLGSALLQMAVYDMSSPLKITYRNALKKRQLPEGTPKSVGECTLAFIIGDNKARAIDTLETQLRAA